MTNPVCEIIHRVKMHKNLSQVRSRWLNKPVASYLYDDWLIDKGSLTKRLQQRYAKFSVQAFAVKYAKPIQDEAALLRSPSYKAVLIREVLLMGNNKAVVFAHSVLPRASLRGAWHGLGRLGNKPLGATLFANPKVQRTPLSYKKLSVNHKLYQQAMKCLAHSLAQHLSQHLLQASIQEKPLYEKPNYLWARRSIFSLNRANIMVTEIFLPQLLAKLLTK